VLEDLAHLRPRRIEASVLDRILQPELYLISTEYSPQVRITIIRRAVITRRLDNIDIFAGSAIMQIKVDFLCRDSILAGLLFSIWCFSRSGQTQQELCALVFRVAEFY